MGANNSSDDYLEEKTGAIGAILYTPSSYPESGFTFKYRSTHDPTNPDGNGTPGQYSSTDYPAKYYAQVLLAVDTSAAPPYPYVALRIEPDRLSVIAYDGTTVRELDSAQVATAANTWYTVQMRIVAGGPVGGMLSVERVSETAGDAVATLMQSVPLSELPAIESSAIGFTVGALAGYQFQLVEYADAPDLSDTFVDWSYDAYGRRVAETVYDSANAATSQTLYVWDGWRLVSELDGLNGDRVVAEYVPGSGYVDDVVAVRRDLNRDGDFEDANEGFLYYLTDQQHSTVALVDGTGAVVERYGYDAFGTPAFHAPDGTSRTASLYGNNRLYTGREWLPSLGVYDYRQRLYNPITGRFLTTDPANDPANLGNPYTYVGNNPGAFLDPYGEDAIDLIVTGQWNPDANTWQQAYGGFGLGASEGGTVVADAATLGLNANLNAQAQAIKADARARGDVLSQVGFGLGEVGVASGQAAVFLVAAPAAGALPGAASARAALASRPLLSTGLTLGGYVAAGSAGIYQASTGIRAAVDGDIAGAISSFGNAGLGVLGGGSLVRKAGGAILPQRGTIQAARAKGQIGEALTSAERFLRGERVVGRNVNFVAQGERSNVDFVTQNRFTGQINAIETKFGLSAKLNHGQRAVAGVLERSGTALVRGPQSMATMRRLGFTGGSARNGMIVSGLGYIEQRFDALARVFGALLY